MAECSFKIPFSGNPADILNKASSAVEKQDGNFSGDEVSGVFDVSVFGNKIAGSYTVENQVLNLDINTKPFMIPCSMIESFLVKQIS